MLDYRFNEGPRAKWLTGEIFIDKGLEDALNIDRDSFNRFHPEYRQVQAHVHKILHEELFPEVYRQIDVRSKRKARAKNKQRRSHLRSVIALSLDKKVQIDRRKESATAPSVVEMRETANSLKISLPSEQSLKIGKTNRELASAILSIFEVALREKSREQQRKVFSDLLLQVLSRW